MKKITLFIFLLTFSLGFSQNAPVNFETPGQGADWSWTVGADGPDPNPALEFVANPNTTGINTSATVAKFTALVTGASYALTFSTGIGTFTLDNTNSLVKIMVKKDVASDFAVKLEGPGGFAHENRIAVPSTIVDGEWVELTFDFKADEGKVASTLVIIPDFQDGRTTDNIIYFDNLTFNPQAGGGGGTEGNVVTVDPAAAWIGYMNVFNTSGGFEFGSGWAVTDLKSTIGATNITLQPNYNTYANALVGNDGDRAYWTNSTDGGVTPGPLGNKNMEASTFVEPGATFNGKDLTFKGTVESNTIKSGYTAKYFIKALDPNAGYSDVFAGSKVFDLPASGTFTITATAAELASGLIIQYGFVIYGLNANPADIAANGSVVVGAASLSTKSVALSKFVAYPNPTQNNWTISSPNFEISSVQVFDVIGKNVITLSPKSNEVTIDASQLNSGLYFARINTANGSSSLKLVKK